MCEWRSKVNPDYFCDVPPEPGSPYCIFHLEGAKRAERFREAIARQMRGSRSVEGRNAPFDFTGYRFPSAVTVHAASTSDVCAVLPDKIDRDLCLAESVISGDLIINDLDLAGALDLRSAVVKGRVEFISGDADGGLWADQAEFHDVFDCRSTSIRAERSAPGIGSRAAFSARGAVFDKGLLLYGCTLDGLVVLADALARGDLTLDGSRIEGGLYMQAADWRGWECGGKAVPGELLSLSG